MVHRVFLEEFINSEKQSLYFFVAFSYPKIIFEKDVEKKILGTIFRLEKKAVFLHGGLCISFLHVIQCGGEKYLIVPSYSPENNPKGRNSRLTANASMDIAAARDGLRMMIKVEEAVQNEGWEERVFELRELAEKMPEYLFDETGALREWSAEGFEDNHEHRHISHLYCAWPAFETQNDAELVRACNQAILNRNVGDGGKRIIMGSG